MWEENNFCSSVTDKVIQQLVCESDRNSGVIARGTISYGYNIIYGTDKGGYGCSPTVIPLSLGWERGSAQDKLTDYLMRNILTNATGFFQSYSAADTSPMPCMPL